MSSKYFVNSHKKFTMIGSDIKRNKRSTENLKKNYLTKIINFYK